MITKEQFNHTQHIQLLNNHFLEEDWVWLYKKSHSKDCDIDLYNLYFTYLATPTNAAISLSSSNRDLEIDSPCAIMSDYTYRPHIKPGYEHLVVIRKSYNFEDIRISDEFIYFHKLFEKRTDDKTIFFAIVNQREINVCEICKNSVRVLNRYLTEFMAAKKMDLICTCQSEIEFWPDKVTLPFSIEFTPHFNFKDISPNYHSNYKLCVAADCGMIQNWFNGKTIFRHTSLKKIYEQMKESISYIIGTDENGVNIKSNEDTYPYTPVFFKKDIQSHYNNKENNTVDILTISTPSFTLRCDNDHDDYIVVFLKDLMDLPYEEQFIWRSYNIPPDGKTFSHIFQSSIIEGNWQGVTFSIDFIFRDVYQNLLEKWEERYMWSLIKPLNGVQIEAPKKICTLTSNNYDELKSLVENLVLSLQESFNSDKLSAITPKQNIIKDVIIDGNTVKKVFTEPPIDHFHRVCSIMSIEDAPFYEFLKNLQSLRSYMLHRNPSKDKKEFKKFFNYFGLKDDKSNSKEVSYNILQKGVDTIIFFTNQII